MKRTTVSLSLSLSLALTLLRTGRKRLVSLTEISFFLLEGKEEKRTIFKGFDNFFL